MAPAQSGDYCTIRWPQPRQATIVQSDGHNPFRRLLYSQMATTQSGDYCTVRWPQLSQATIVQSNDHNPVRRLLYSHMAAIVQSDGYSPVRRLLYSQMVTTHSGDYCTKEVSLQSDDHSPVISRPPYSQTSVVSGCECAPSCRTRTSLHGTDIIANTASLNEAGAGASASLSHGRTLQVSVNTVPALGPVLHVINTGVHV